MADGAIRAIKDIKVGDKVLGVDSGPRTVKAVHSGTDVMYKVHESCPAVDYDEVDLNLINFVCNSWHTLHLVTHMFIGRVKAEVDESGFYVRYTTLATKMIDGEAVKMIVFAKQTFSISQYDDSEKALYAAEAFKDSLDGSNITWELEARFYEDVDKRIRQLTFQLASPVLIENQEFASICKKAGLPVNKLNDLAWLLGCWIGNGSEKASIISVNTSEENRVERIQDICELAGLEQRTSKIGVDIFSEETKLNTLLKLMNEFSLEKTIPTWLSTEAIPVREHVLAGLIDSSGHVIGEESCKQVLFISALETIIAGVVALARSMGIKYVVSEQKDYIDDRGLQHDIAFSVSLMPCSALTRVLGLAFTDCKRVAPLTSVRRVPVEYSFNVVKQDVAQYVGFTLE